MSMMRNTIRHSQSFKRYSAGLQIIMGVTIAIFFIFYWDSKKFLRGVIAEEKDRIEKIVLHSRFI